MTTRILPKILLVGILLFGLARAASLFNGKQGQPVPPQPTAIQPMDTVVQEAAVKKRIGLMADRFASQAQKQLNLSPAQKDTLIKYRTYFLTESQQIRQTYRGNPVKMKEAMQAHLEFSKKRFSDLLTPEQRAVWEAKQKQGD